MTNDKSVYIELKMNCGDNKNWKKYVLLALNLVFLISAIILIWFSLDVVSQYTDFIFFLPLELFYPSIIQTVIGSVIIIISCFAFGFGFKRNYCLTITFAILLTLSSIMVLAVGSYCFFFELQVRGIVEGPFKDLMKEYNPYNPNNATEMWDYVQKIFACCGSENYKDWELQFNGQLPLSCCNTPSGGVGNFSCTTNLEDTNRYPQGCFEYFSTYIGSQVGRMRDASISIGIIMFFGVLLDFYLACCDNKVANTSDLLESLKPVV